MNAYVRPATGLWFSVFYQFTVQIPKDELKVKQYLHDIHTKRQINDVILEFSDVDFRKQCIQKMDTEV